MAPWKTQHISPTFLLMTSTPPWKLLVVMNHVPMEIIKYKIEAFIIFLDKAFLTVINMKINGSVQQRHQQNYIDANSTVHYTINHIIFHGMVKISASMNSETLDVIYTPSPHILKI